MCLDVLMHNKRKLFLGHYKISFGVNIEGKRVLTHLQK